MSPLVLVTVIVILVATPLAALASAFVWSLYRADRSNGVTLALAVMVTAATIAGVLLAIPTVFFVLGRSLPFSGQLVLVAIDVLLPTAIIAPAYLWWLDHRPGR